MIKKFVRVIVYYYCTKLRYVCNDAIPYFGGIPPNKAQRTKNWNLIRWHRKINFKVTKTVTVNTTLTPLLNRGLYNLNLNFWLLKYLRCNYSSLMKIYTERCHSTNDILSNGGQSRTVTCYR